MLPIVYFICYAAEASKRYGNERQGESADRTHENAPTGLTGSLFFPGCSIIGLLIMIPPLLLTDDVGWAYLFMIRGLAQLILEVYFSKFSTANLPGFLGFASDRTWRWIVFAFLRKQSQRWRAGGDDAGSHFHRLLARRTLHPDGLFLTGCFDEISTVRTPEDLPVAGFHSSANLSLATSLATNINYQETFRDLANPADPRPILEPYAHQRKRSPRPDETSVS